MPRNPQNFPDPTPDAAQISARLACRQLIINGFALADEGRAVAIADLFTEHGVHAVDDHVASGREQIREVLAARDADTARRTLHVITNTRFGFSTTDRIQASSLLTLFLLSAPEAQRLIPRALARVDDKFVRDSDGRWWLDQRHTMVIAGRR